jgi:16S rRNA (guanine527-N7)-methyltransferase
MSLVPRRRRGQNLKSLLASLAAILVDGHMTNSNLDEYCHLVANWPGLVSRSQRQQVRPLVEDCLTLLDHLGSAENLVDVGSGGGMPGIPLLLARPDLKLTLIEADQRKAAFLYHASASLGLEVEVIAERAEVAGHGPHRESFDLAVCRALAAMPVVAELCLPLVKIGGRLLAMQSQPLDCLEAARLLGGGSPRVLPSPSAARPQGVVVEIEKRSSTPGAYPRRPGRPAQHPLGVS